MKSPLLINNNSPIGIFDSGLGGLTVLQKIQEVLPNENYIYFGDTAHLPYGSKSNKCIIEYSKNIIEFMLQKNVKAIIIACNSASSVAIETIKKNYDIPIFEVITPATIRAVEQTKTKHICIIGTETTISSKIYSKKICEFNNYKIDTILGAAIGGILLSSGHTGRDGADGGSARFPLFLLFAKLDGTLRKHSWRRKNHCTSRLNLSNGLFYLASSFCVYCL